MRIDLPEGVPTEGFSSIKDDTDTMLAIKEAIHRGYEEIDRDFPPPPAAGG